MNPTKEQLERINLFTRRTLTADEVFVFSVILCDNEIDRDGERFTYESLDLLGELYIGKSGVFDHNPKAENQSARIFDTKLVKEGKNSLGEDYYSLIAWAYMVRCDKNADLILEIDAGIKKEVSVGCAIEKVICSICGTNRKTSHCGHKKGETYDDRICYHDLENPTDAYEWSFVAVPNMRKTSNKKTYMERDISMSKFYFLDCENDSNIYEAENFNEALYKHYVSVEDDDKNQIVHTAIMAMPNIEKAVELFNKLASSFNEIKLIVDVANAIYIKED